MCVGSFYIRSGCPSRRFKSCSSPILYIHFWFRLDICALLASLQDRGILDHIPMGLSHLFKNSKLFLEFLSSSVNFAPVRNILSLFRSSSFVLKIIPLNNFKASAPLRLARRIPMRNVEISKYPCLFHPVPVSCCAPYFYIPPSCPVHSFLRIP